ncbi:MAG: hypothetical protein ACPG32_04395 [Akkermansiaceae bacterium]
MSRDVLYSQLTAPFGGVIFERAVERVLVKLFQNFQQLDGEPLSGVPIHPGVRGVPLIFETYDPNDAGTSGTEFADAKKAASHIMILASGYQEHDGGESCKLRVVVATHMRDGEPAEQEAKHEQWCAAARGIMSPSAQAESVNLCNQLSEEISTLGWEADEPAQDEFVRHRWVHTLNYDFTGAMLREC